MKKEIMKELLDRYEQLENMKQCDSAKETVRLYIRKLELRLVDILK